MSQGAVSDEVDFLAEVLAYVKMSRFGLKSVPVGLLDPAVAVVVEGVKEHGAELQGKLEERLKFKKHEALKGI